MTEAKTFIDPLLGRRSALPGPDYAYTERTSMEAMRRADWALVDGQRERYDAALRADLFLAMLSHQADAPSYGYAINMYRHCLQSATLLHQAGFDEATVVVGLLHDVAFGVCHENHGPAAAELLKPWCGDKHYWMLRHHGDFMDLYCHDRGAPNARAYERWRGHKWFDWAAEFVGKYDQNAMDANTPTAPLEFFAPMARRFFARPPAQVAPHAE